GRIGFIEQRDGTLKAIHTSRPRGTLSAQRATPAGKRTIAPCWIVPRENRRRPDSNRRITDLQSVPLIHLGTPPRAGDDSRFGYAAQASRLARWHGVGTAGMGISKSAADGLQFLCAARAGGHRARRAQTGMKNRKNYSLQRTAD